MQIEIKKLVDFIARHAVWFSLGLISIILMAPGWQEIKTIWFIAFFEALAISLSGLALYAYTEIKFTSQYLDDGDKIKSDVEKAGMYKVISFVFLSVHLLVGLIVLGVYIAQFSKP